MSNESRRLWLLVAVLGPFAVNACGDVLLLHNDNIIEGTIVRADGDLAVRDDRGNVRYVATTQVQYRCRTRAEAYRWKRRRIEPQDVRGHIRLAQWCLTNELLTEASDQLLHLSSIAPDHAAIRTIERRLLNFNRDDQGSSHTILPVVHHRPLRKQGQQWQHELPDSVIAEFKRSVQPVLVNRCGQIACHGATTSSSFQLSIHRNRVLGREMTTSNLQLVTAYLDQTDISQSRFLKFARTPHGPLRKPAIGSHEFEIYQNLLKWAQTVVADAEQNSVESSLANIQSEDPPNAVPTPAEQMLSARAEYVKGPNGTSPIELVDPSEPNDTLLSGTNEPPPRTGKQAALPSVSESTRPTDSSNPFDPAAFNERYHRK